MHHRMVRRGVGALALVTVLSFSGARPAAAGELDGFRGSLSWLARFLAGDRVSTTQSLLDAVGGWLHMTDAAASSMGTDKGLGIDPNGNRAKINNANPDDSGD
jgi:hypothetical protein